MSALLKVDADKHRKLASDLLALLEAVQAENSDAMLVMCLASVTMLVFFGILTPYHRSRSVRRGPSSGRVQENFETNETVKKFRSWPNRQIAWAALKRSGKKMEKEQKKIEKVSPLMAPDTLICGTSRKAESVFGCGKEMEVDHQHLSLRRIFVQAQSKVIFHPFPKK